MDEMHADFAEWLIRHDRGRTHTDVSDAMKTLLESVLATDKAGSVTLLIQVKPADIDDRRMIVTATVNTKLPSPDAKPAIYFVDDGGHLTRNDPAQDFLPGLNERTKN